METKINYLHKIVLISFISFLAAMPDGFDAVNDNVPILEDESKKISILRNDIINNKENLDLKIISAPTLGNATVDGWKIEYVPNKNVNGNDQFKYQIDNGFSTDTATVNITIAPVNDPPTRVELMSGAVNENQPSGTEVGNLKTVDPDFEDSFIYEFSDEGQSDNEFFVIKDNTIFTSIPLDFEAKSTFKLQVRSKDRKNASVTSSVDVLVADINEGPVFEGEAQLVISHPEDGGRIVSKISVIDPDITQSSVKYKVVGGEDKNRFKITRGGDLTFLREPDFENPTDTNRDNIYNIEFKAMDSKDNNLFTSGFATITIMDSPEKTIKSIDSRKFVAWTVDHLPYHILMEDAVKDYINMRFSNDGESYSSIDDVNGESISDLDPNDQIIIIQQKGNTKEIYEIWYGNGLDYTVINRERVDWVFSQDIQEVLIAKDQYLNSDSETVFHKTEEDRLMASFGSKFAVWHPNNFVMSLTSLSMRSNLLQYATNISVGNELIGLPGSLSGSSELGIATRNSEFGVRLPFTFDFNVEQKPEYISPDYLGLYSKVNINNLFSTKSDFHGLMGFSFYPRSSGTLKTDPGFFASDTIDAGNQYINILDSYAMASSTVDVPLRLGPVGRITASPGIHYMKIAHRSKKNDDLYERNFYSSSDSIKTFTDDKSYSTQTSFYIRFDVLGKIGQKPELLEKFPYFNFIQIYRVPFYELSLQFISSLSTIITLNINIIDDFSISVSRFSRSASLEGNWVPDSNTWLGIRYRANF